MSENAKSETGAGFASNLAFALAVAIGLVLAPIYLMGIYSQNAVLHLITVTAVALGTHSNNRSSHIAALISNGINLTLFVLIALVTFLRTIETIPPPTQQVVTSSDSSGLTISSNQLLYIRRNYLLLHEISDLSEPLLQHFDDMKVVLFAFQVAVVVIFSILQLTIWLAYRSTNVLAQVVSVWIGLLKFCFFDCVSLFGSIYAIISLGSFVVSLFKVSQSADVILANVGIYILLIVAGLLITAAELFPIAGKFKQMPVFYRIALLIDGLQLFLAVSTLIVIGSLLAFDEYNDKIVLYHAESFILVIVFSVVFYGFFQYILWSAFKECKSAKPTAKCINGPRNNDAQNFTGVRPVPKKWSQPVVQPTNRIPNNDGMTDRLQTQPSAPIRTEIHREPTSPNPMPPASVSSTTKVNIAQRPISGWNVRGS